MEQSKTFSTYQHINKALFTARLIDGFWDRFIVHGVGPDDIEKIRPTLTSQESWVCGWGKLAHEKVVRAKDLQKNGSIQDAENLFRTAGLYFQLAQWILTERSEEKAKWLEMSINVFGIADKLSSIQTKYETIKVGSYQCFGRVRIPSNPKGVVVIINPFDSTKEELFTYEMDYASNGFITVSFDGPGQGETFVKQGLKATAIRWKTFVDSLIDYAAVSFPEHKLFLFGISSGAAWAVYGSTLPQVTKAVAVSPAFLNDSVTLPDYFLERIDNLTDSETTILPNFDHLNYRNPVLLVHGKKDLMVSEQNIYDLYEKLPQGKKLLEYENEGHCCNYKLSEIRKISMGWFIEGGRKSYEYQ
jgi:pimeloyl-ACP methyl ester carboxylesterase